MKKTLSKIFLLTSLGLSTVSQAAYQVGPVNIEFMRTYKNYAVLSLDPNGVNSDNCTHASSGNYAYIDLSNGEGKAMYAAALSAFMVNRRIRVALSGCKSWGSSTIPSAYRLDIYQAQ